MNQGGTAIEDRPAVLGKSLAQLVPQPGHGIRMSSQRLVRPIDLFWKSDSGHPGTLVSRLPVSAQPGIRRMVHHDLSGGAHDWPPRSTVSSRLTFAGRGGARLRTP